LGHVAYARLFRVAMALEGTGGASDEEASAVGRKQTACYAGQGGLACAIFSHERMYLAGEEAKVSPSKGLGSRGREEFVYAA
jgi:hypothetical protein